MEAAPDVAVVPLVAPVAAVPAPRAAARGQRILTHSAMDAWSRCETEYRLAYEEMIVPTTYPAALAVGSAVHAGVEALHLGRTLGEAIAQADRELQRQAERSRLHLDDDKADLEVQLSFDRARVWAMLHGWFARYDATSTAGIEMQGRGLHDRELEVLETELVLEAPLVNPISGRPSRTFLLSGKVDALVRRRDERYRTDPASGLLGWYIAELKTTGEELAEFEEAMTVSAQPAVYQTLALAHFDGRLGPLLGTVLDVIRKPTIRPKKGETPEEFARRALQEYQEEPDRFFRRTVLPTNERLRHEVLVTAWRIADGIRRAERFGYLQKRGPACRGGYGPCRYRSLCWYGERTDFTRKDTAHEELGPR
jgi:hypothetical protein